jgi:succinate dehydrogenase hydrophobic anchor subunit
MTTLGEPSRPRHRPGVRHEVAADRGPRRARVATYLTVRVTGLILAVLVLGHFALTHIVTDVAEADAAFIARRWSSALWVAWDGTMLTAALVHGAAGVWIAIEDYTVGAARRRRALGALVAGTALLLAIGWITLVVVIVG